MANSILHRCPVCDSMIGILLPNSEAHGRFQCENCTSRRYACHHQVFSSHQAYLRHLSRFQRPQNECQASSSLTPTASSIIREGELETSPEVCISSAAPEDWDINDFQLSADTALAETEIFLNEDLKADLTEDDLYCLAALKAQCDTHLSWRKTDVWLKILHAENSRYPSSMKVLQCFARKIKKMVYPFEPVYLFDPTKPEKKYLLNDWRVEIAHRLDLCYFGTTPAGHPIDETFHSPIFSQTQQTSSSCCIVGIFVFIDAYARTRFSQKESYAINMKIANIPQAESSPIILSSFPELTSDVIIQLFQQAISQIHNSTFNVTFTNNLKKKLGLKC